MGRGALRTHLFLLHEGGWWDVREMARAIELSDLSGLFVQLQTLMHHGCITRKGAGVAGDPYRYGVTATCTDPKAIRRAQCTPAQI